MAISDVSSRSFASEMWKLSKTIVWKHESRAVQGDTKTALGEMEAYMAARKGELNFRSIAQFHDNILQAFFPNQDEYFQVAMSKKNIPEEMRDRIVAAEQEYLVRYWEEDGEPNPYYRMLMGKPPKDMDPKDMAYNTAYADIDMKVPIHELAYSDRLILEKRGYFETLMASDETGKWEYLKYAGRNRILPYIARQAEPFELLAIGDVQVTKLKKDFVDVYEQARRMVVRVYYSDAYRNKDSLYERFLGMMILLITQMRMCSKYIDTTVTRDFYDLESLKVLYDAYGFPFYSSIPLSYHVTIVKRLNELISYKGSTQVFYDVFNIFDFGTMDVFEYFLVKRRLRDRNGNPIFRDKYGRPLTEDQMYQLRFAKVPWREDKFVGITNTDNITSYDELTVPDPYWVEDDVLHQKLMERDWNYYHSKYMGVQIMFDLNRLIFETCYFLRMLEDNRFTTEDITTYYPVTGTDIPLFDLVIYAVALLCKNAGYNGEIPAEPVSVAGVYGFNFKEYATLLKMTVESMSTFVINFKSALRTFVEENPVLSSDTALLYWIDQITDGAFEYLGDDFDFGGHKAPPPMFLKDFIPTNNSVENLIAYLRGTLDLFEKGETTEVELNILYQALVTKDNFIFEVWGIDHETISMAHKIYYLKKEDYTDEDLEELKHALKVSYEHMLSWIIKLLHARRALTFDPHLYKIIQDMDIENLQDVDTVFRHIEELDEYLTYKIQRVHTKWEYTAYHNLRKILMTTSLMNETFAKKNGNVAKTYADLLSEINPILYRRLTSEETDLDNEEQYVIQTLMNLCDDLKLLQAANPANLQRIIEYLMKILKFLKSAKVDLVDFELIYMLTDRSANHLKLLSELWSCDVDATVKDFFNLFDAIHKTKIFQILEEYPGIRFENDKLASYVCDYIFDGMTMTDWGELTIERTEKDWFVYWYDWVADILSTREIRENLNWTEIHQLYATTGGGTRENNALTLQDDYELEVNYELRSQFKLWEQLWQELEQELRDAFLLEDRFQDVLVEHEVRSSVTLDDRIKAIERLVERQLREGLTMNDHYKNHVYEEMGSHEYLRLADRRYNQSRVYFDQCNDAIMWHDTLIKISEELVDPTDPVEP